MSRFEESKIEFFTRAVDARQRAHEALQAVEKKAARWFSTASEAEAQDKPR